MQGKEPVDVGNVWYFWFATDAFHVDKRLRRLNRRLPSDPRCKFCNAPFRGVGGAVATTSANLSDQPPALSADEALAALGGRVAAVLDDGPSPGGVASTVVDCTSERPVVLRTGPLSAADLGLEAS